MRQLKRARSFASQPQFAITHQSDSRSNLRIVRTEWPSARERERPVLPRAASLHGIDISTCLLFNIPQSGCVTQRVASGQISL